MRTLIIGGTSGVGAEIATLLRDQDGVDSLCPRQTELDVRIETGERRAIRNFLEEYGPFENLVYTAGVNRLTWLKDMTGRDFDQHYDVNVRGLVLVVANHLRLFPAQPVNLVAIVSDSYRTPMRSSLAYGSSKAALHAALRNMARELASEGWRVNGVSPGIIEDTPMTDYIDRVVPIQRGWTPEEAKAYENTMVPIGRRVTKLEVAQTVRDVLFGAEAMTGSIIEITGGK